MSTRECWEVSNDEEETEGQQEHTMQIQVNTDHNIEGRETLAAWIRGTVETALGRDSDHITRVEVHLTDEDGRKSGQNDKLCVMEARLEGRQPIAVSDRSETLEQAVNGAAGKLARLVESTLGRAAHLKKPQD